MNQVGSHRRVLKEVLTKVSRSVLELGAGNFSTPLIHNTVSGRAKILTIDDNRGWLYKFRHMESASHDFKYINNKDIQEFYDNDTEPWELVFVDNGSWDARIAAIKKYKDIADYMVIHDCTILPGNGIGKTLDPMVIKMRHTGKRDYSDTFKYWREYFVLGWGKQNPATLVASNKIDLNRFKVRHMTIAGKN